MRKFLLLFLCLATVLSSWSQPKTVTGKIVDYTGAPLSGATVSIKGKKVSLASNTDGSFSISAAPGETLQVSMVGFASQDIKIGQAQNYTVIMQLRSGDLDEVVVTALGIQRQPKSLGYSTAKIKNAELTQARAVNLQQGLVGKVSGLNITTTNNSVFENTRINLRGIRSLTGNNQPLLVIDGIPTPLSYLSSINPNDVNDVNILKGASAAAIYGPDGVNGVLILTTKRGKKGVVAVNFSSSYQLSKVSYMPKRQRSFGSGSTVDAFGNPLYIPYENYSFGDPFDGSIRTVGVPLEDGSEQKLVYQATPRDEQKRFWNEHNASVFQNDISISTEGYYLSIQDAIIKGITPKDQNRRSSFRFNASRKFNRFESSFSLNYVRSVFNVVDNESLSTRYSSSYGGSIYNLVLQSPPHIPLTSYKNWRNDKFSQYSNYFNEYASNPYWAIDNHRSKGRSDDLIASMEFHYDIASWLRATARVGTNLSLEFQKDETAPIIVSDWARANRSNTHFNNFPGSVYDFERFTSRVNGEFFLSGKRTVGELGINYLAGAQTRQNDSKFLEATGNNLVVPYLYNLSNRTGESIATEQNIKNRLVSLFGSIGLSYKGWANMEFTGRNDKDSRLSTKQNSYFYPGVSASVVLSDAIPLIKNSAVISYLKVRGSLSKSGNVNLATYALDPTYVASGGFPYGNLAAYTASNSIPDPNLSPEFVKSKEVGLEIGFLKNRFNIEATYFYQKNTDQVLSVQQSFTTGYSSRLANTADFKNYGFELDLRLTPLVKIGKGKIDLKINGTYNDNKILRLSDDVNELSIGGSNNFIQLKAGAPNAFNYAIVGMPAFVYKLTDYERDPQGRVIVDAVSGNPQLSDSLVTAGRTMPKWILGFNPSFEFKGFSISLTLDYKGGHNAYHGLGTDMDGYGISERSAQFNRQRFVFPNSVYWDGTKYVENTNLQVSGTGIDFWGDDTYNTQIATNYFTSAAAWKLREVAVGYTIPSKWLGSKKIIKNASLNLTARNLFTWLPKSNQWSDPEFNYTSTGNTNGVSSVFQTPPVRTFGAAINLTF